MEKNGERQDPEKKEGFGGEYDLDCGYVSPIKTMRDLTVDNLKSLVVSSRYIQTLIVLTILGFFLRFYHLGYNSLWLDEACTYTLSVNSFTYIWQTMATGEINPPLFYWAEHIMLVFGNNEVILRFIPALFGVFTIPVFYLVGKEFFDRNVGIIAAAGCTFSSFLINYSQEARAYSMALFFIAVAVFFFFKAINSGTFAYWGIFGVFSALGFWTHFYTFVIITALVLYALVLWIPHARTEIKNLKMLVVGIFVYIFLCLPMILNAVPIFIQRTASEPHFGFQGLNIISNTFYQISGVYIIGAIVLVSFFIMGIMQIYVINKNKGIFLILVTVFTFAVSCILSFTMPIEPRYIIFFNLIFFVGIACSYRIFSALFRPPIVVYGLIVFLCIISIPALPGYYNYGYSQTDWRNFSGILAEKTNPNDVVVAVPGYTAQPLDYYYSSIKDDTRECGATTSQDLEKIYSQKGNSSIYYIVTEDIRSANPNGDAITWLKNNTHYLGKYTYIYLYGSP